MSPKAATAKGETESVAVSPTATAEYDTGIEIRYFERDDKATPKVKRHYDIRKLDDDEQTAWHTVPSVSSILDTLDAPPTWWGMQIGVDGVVQLYNTGLLFPVEVQTVNGFATVLGLRDPLGQIVTAGRDNIVELLQKHRLTTNDQKTAGGKRGQSVHDAFSRWMDHGELPDVMEYPPQEQGYITGLLKFLADSHAVPISSEVMVASAKHDFAGRYDARLGFEQEARVVAHFTPVKGPQWTTVPPGEHLADLKTPKYVFFTHPKQLAGYEICSLECGFEPTSARAVIQVTADGLYRYVRADEWATPEDFLTTLAEWRSEQEMKKRKPPGGRH